MKHPRTQHHWVALALAACAGLAPKFSAATALKPVREGDIYQISLKRMAIAKEHAGGLTLACLIDGKPGQELSFSQINLLMRMEDEGMESMQP